MDDRVYAEQVACKLRAQYGEDAEVIAMLRAAEVAAFGDREALTHWDEVIAILADDAQSSSAGRITS